MTGQGRPIGRTGQDARFSLLARLLATVLALLAAVSLIIGTATLVALHGFLVNRVDQQLTLAAHRSQGRFGQPPPGAPQPGGSDAGGAAFPEILGNAAGTVGARIVDGRVLVAGRVQDSGDSADLPATDDAVLVAVPVDGLPHTRSLGELGSYRLVAARTPDGDVIVTGLPLADVDSTLFDIALVELAVAGSGLVVTGLAGATIIRRSLRPLRRMAATARQVSGLHLDKGEVALSVRVPDSDTDPRTEVGQVGAALNRMLRHVAAALAARHDSETRVRQFVADASHELRTPLAAIRGYAELTRRHQDGLPAEVAFALSRVESESARMGALVDDLLLLARLDSGRPLQRTEVDLTRLLLDAANDARAAGPTHPIRLELPQVPVVVTGDPDRLHQAVANLLSNTRVHTPPGTTVNLRLTAPDPGWVRIVVADDGPGIPPTLLPEVFERFSRADTARSRAVGSTGLGLAIVTAIVRAHHGQVDVTSRPRCTEFTVTLPTTVTPPTTLTLPTTLTGSVSHPAASNSAASCPAASNPADPVVAAVAGWTAAPSD